MEYGQSTVEGLQLLSQRQRLTHPLPLRATLHAAELTELAQASLAAVSTCVLRSALPCPPGRFTGVLPDS